MKLVLKVLGIVFLLFVVVSVLSMFYLSRGLEEGLNVNIAPVDLILKEDGVYKGSYDFGRWSNELTITVKNNRITKIEITDDMMFVNPDVRNELFKRVMEKQNTTVDAVSGGTVSCKAYLKSIENALNN
ncbi:MAG TPA: FMN-binding protein [Sedimentibacter sp.]|jgi:uncharacterized protein with FMN-binding domain|nr:FMN-binding protein [Sedimentibacter sp.]NLA13231.1 FMN-binding protein [Tissierellia bacterium]HOA19241.1 FMN-binding protein [Sedimentibacter sp.]HOG63653.1 FMN-binding protein [Sedimentibacter sp.]HOT22040.1 FMN-binding protein [Sedimentibacter sp.]